MTAVSELMSVPYALYAANSQPGPKGDKGDKGDAGPQGPAGKNGVDGKNGLDGKDGLQGPQGLKGDTGLTGAQGPKGDTGAQGLAGKDGKVEFQNLKVSQTGDTLYLTNGNFVIIPGISTAQPKPINGYGPIITDIDGNTYKTVYIGKQQWMSENLKTAKYSDGTIIQNITDNTQWNNLSSGAWSYYNNDAANNSKYGKLYNWYAVSPTTNGNKNICPTGWHVPSDTEWTVMIDYLGGENVAGGKMKEIGITNWASPNTDATNTSLFTGLPGGLRYGSGGGYFGVGDNGYWWSSSEYDITNAWIRQLKGSNGIVNRSLGVKGKRSGYSVRCLKD